ncbi:guanosine-diphosphatase [Coprinopsis sp. MPI-PUGE-AT-0042]|nr:guanosine-diphosphatase [Coprinopsis sp. MPI-PUGE-AT-0042]
MAMAAFSMVSPRSGNYDRLEGGMGPSRTGLPAHQRGWRRFGWKKFAIGAAVLIGIVWLFGPREKVDWQQAKDYAKDLIPFKPPKPDAASHLDSQEPPGSFETDPDPSKTTHCKTPHDPTKPLVQYALMIDAGSTGSRIHIYKFNNCKASPTYEYEVFKMTNPGLSKFADDPEGGAKTLDVLLNEAVRVVPEDMQHCTPVAVKATAGLRLLPGTKSQDILDAVEDRIPRPHDGVVIMDGKDEGVYAWITANYLLGTIKPGKEKTTVGKARGPTYAVLDLGGASTQIVFEPTHIGAAANLEAGEHKYDLAFSGSQYELYQHSHVHKLVDFMASIRPRPATQPKFHPYDKDGDGEPDYDVVPNPCLARQTERTVEVEDEFFDDGASHKRNVTMAGLDVGSFDACDRVVQLVLAKDAICEMKPCSFNGVLLLSYFYDRVNPLLPPKSKQGKTSSSSALTPAPPLTVASIATYAKTMCGGPDVWEKVPHWIAKKELMKEIHGRPEWCLDLTFMHGLLKWGYEFEESRSVEFGKQIKGTELGWCLGATLALVGAGDIKCTA